jgi:phage shock protein PspC (stress-responsive transcriptional regulator)
VQGRTFAGVCGAFARATGTDPVLWRVVLVVLTIFGGVGAVIYLLAWLLLPADGDTATPVEALAGRGRSRTSTARTVVGLVIVAIALAGYSSAPDRATPLIALLVLGGVLLLLLRDRSRGGTGVAGSSPPPYVPLVPPGGPVPPTARPPYGPYPVPPTPGMAWPLPPIPPRRPRSRLGGLTLSLALVVLGAVGALDLAGVGVPTLAYVAAPLAVIGIGLLVGAWFGRARWLIPLGIVLCIALAGGSAALVDGHWGRPSIGQVSYAPTSVTEVADNYHRNVGELTLDLSDVDFTGHDVNVTVRVDVGDLTVTLPSNVDVVADASVGAGDARVLGQDWSGLGNETRTVSDLGPDGTGGGRLHLIASVGMGNLEIKR